MLLSRGAIALRAAKLLSSNANSCKTAIRNSHAPWVYRKASPPADKRLIYVAEAVQGFAWWWVLWHLWTQYDHVTGEFEYPDASQWTDAELGIPPEK